jgi:simple sugar transport system ATP-binding protein
MTDAQTGSGVPLLETRSLIKSYGATRALDDVSLSVRAGQSLALVGRNGAGKSTLVRLLTGLEAPDSGEILFAGTPAPATSARDAWRALVACVYQRSTVIPELTVGENLFINDQPRTRGVIRWRELRREARELLDVWGLDVSPDTRAGDLPVGQRQLLEIARALRRGSRLIILDEPTAQLELREIEQLFDQMRRLKKDGVTFVFISHHLDEVYDVCERAVVLRDGRLVADDVVAALPKEALVSAMVGQDVTERTSRRAEPVAERPDGDVVLSVEDLTVAGRVEGVSLAIRAGEKLGVAGLTGSGRVELAEAIVGQRKPDAGSVRVRQHEVRTGNVRAARDSGIGYVPGDRHASGFCGNLSVEENISLTVLEKLATAGWVSSRRRRDLADAMIDDLQIKASSPRQPAEELSGGNQQKTVMARAMAVDPAVLVLVSPTAGVDIASKEALFGTIRDAEPAVLLVSDEIDELALCDRVLVMFDGRIHAEFSRDWEESDMVAAIEGMTV